MTWKSLQRCNILLLADLHCGDYRSLRKIPYFAPGWKATFTGMTITNIQRLLHYINTLKEEIHHVIILGDMTVTGTKEEFETIRDELFAFQEHRFGQIEYPSRDKRHLNPEFFTIIPGNHDLNWKSWGGHLLPLRFYASAVMVWLGERLQKRLQYKRVPRQSKWKMRLLLKLFDHYFGNTISDDRFHPTREPQQFGHYEKTLVGTNVRLVPMNTCVSRPVTRIGLNAAGVMLDDQINKLNTPSVSEEYAADDFRIGLAHHFPLAVPLASDMQDRYLELHEAAEIFSSLYNSGRFSAFVCGHKHKDFVWTNSTTVPQVKQTLPVITVGNTTFGLASDEHQCCILEIEDRDLSHCSPATTLIRLKYFQLTQHSSKLIATEEVMTQPGFYREFVGTTRDRVREGRRMPGALIKFLDFSEEEVKAFVEIPTDWPANVKLEYSRWGTRLYGDTQGLLAGFDIRIDASPYGGRVAVRFSCRASDTSEQEPEVWLDSDRAEKPQRFRKVTSEFLADLTLPEIRSDTRIKVQFRWTGMVELIFHYLRISAGT